MRHVGFSTGALALNDVNRALKMLEHTSVTIIELSALRQGELVPLIQQLDNLDLHRFKYKSFHAPSSMEPSFEPVALELLEEVRSRNWPIIVHPDAMHVIQEWARFGELLCIENMDKRKPVGQTAAHLSAIFDQLPQASLCLDLGHARQVDPTMTEATKIILQFKSRLKQLHVSEVNAQSRHERLTFEAGMAFQRVASLIPADIPVILESRVEESGIEEEVSRALYALDPANALAFAGD